jgi:hypothetical protein
MNRHVFKDLDAAREGAGVYEPSNCSHDDGRIAHQPATGDIEVPDLHHDRQAFWVDIGNAERGDGSRAAAVRRADVDE